MINRREGLSLCLMRFLFLLLLLPVLASCYQPLYGTKSMAFETAAGEQALGHIALATIPEANGQALRNLLIDRFYINGRPSAPTRQLVVELKALEEKLGLRKDATSSRARLTLTAMYTLSDNATGKPLFSTSSRSVVSYNMLDDNYATLSSRENAYQRGLKELADIMTSRLLLFTQDHP